MSLLRLQNIWRVKLLSYKNVNTAYIELAKILEDGNLVDSRNGLTKEIHPLAFSIENFDNYMLTNHERVINLPMALAELVWIMIGSDEDWIIKYNKQLEAYSDLDVTLRRYFNAAYGYRIRNCFKINQLQDVVDNLRNNPDSRQSVIIYRDPISDSAEKETKDRACNISSMFLIRDGKLDITQTVRSQDFVWGLPYNLIQFGYITQYIANKLNIKVGKYTEMVNSFHVYEKHWDDLDRIANSKNELYDQNVQPLKNTTDEGFFKTGAKISIFYIRDIMSMMEKSLLYNISFLNNSYLYFPIENNDFWSSGLWIFNSYWLYKKGKIDESVQALSNCSSGLFRSLMVAYYTKYYKKFKEVEGIYIGNKV